jgi:hypothetical protein
MRGLGVVDGVSRDGHNEETGRPGRKSTGHVNAITPCHRWLFMSKRLASAFAKANRAKVAADAQQTGSNMSNIRTANKRHKRSVTLTLARSKKLAKAPAEKAKTAKAKG